MKLKTITNKVRRIYHWLRHPGESLSQRVLHGGVWTFGLRIVNRGFGLIRTIVLARLLAPNDFGLFGIAMLALSSLESFSRTGFDQALIQKKEETESYLDTAWSVQVIRGLVLGGILVAGAPLVGLFFEEPKAILIVRVLGAAEVLKSLRNIGVVYFKKELEFHKQFLYQFSGTLADLAVALNFAFIFRSVWALIFGLLARNLVKLILSYKIHDFRPSLNFDKNKAIELVNFGKWILGTSVLVFVATQGDDIFLGKVLGTTALGFYQMSYKISNLPATELTHVISRVSFPAYSKIQTNIKSLRKAFRKTFFATVALSLPVSVAIFIFSAGLVNYVLGPEWDPIIWPLRILAIFGLTRSVTALWGPLYKAVGEPKYATYSQIVRVFGIFLPLYWLTTRFGLIGTSVSVILGQLGVLFFHLFYLYKISAFKIDFSRVFTDLFGELFSIGITLVFFYLILAPHIQSLISYFVVISLTLLVFVLSMFLIDKLFENPVLEEVRSLLEGSLS